MSELVKLKALGYKQIDVIYDLHYDCVVEYLMLKDKNIVLKCEHDGKKYRANMILSRSLDAYDITINPSITNSRNRLAFNLDVGLFQFYNYHKIMLANNYVQIGEYIVLIFNGDLYLYPAIFNDNCLYKIESYTGDVSSLLMSLFRGKATIKSIKGNEIAFEINGYNIEYALVGTDIKLVFDLKEVEESNE